MNQDYPNSQKATNAIQLFIRNVGTVYYTYMLHMYIGSMQWRESSFFHFSALIALLSSSAIKNDPISEKIKQFLLEVRRGGGLLQVDETSY
jgi:hypothetical protein